MDKQMKHWYDRETETDLLHSQDSEKSMTEGGTDTPFYRDAIDSA